MQGMQSQADRESQGSSLLCPDRQLARLFVLESGAGSFLRRNARLTRLLIVVISLRYRLKPLMEAHRLLDRGKPIVSVKRSTHSLTLPWTVQGCALNILRLTPPISILHWPSVSSSYSPVPGIPSSVSFQTEPFPLPIGILPMPWRLLSFLFLLLWYYYSYSPVLPSPSCSPIPPRHFLPFFNP